eukprot:TRINITY_DN28835_c0_g1_i2.p1 TRINITY_DN28835_c0_g1~~TRINITY_DN28835_c0_g1_i2.p1  ORF type:complete len:218 (-),score=-14.50 TRINITY_DN28835_c0_g1_i2:369-1022(-)
MQSCKTISDCFMFKILNEHILRFKCLQNPLNVGTLERKIKVSIKYRGNHMWRRKNIFQFLHYLRNDVELLLLLRNYNKIDQFLLQFQVQLQGVILHVKKVANPEILINSQTSLMYTTVCFKAQFSIIESVCNVNINIFCLCYVKTFATQMLIDFYVSNKIFRKRQAQQHEHKRKHTYFCFNHILPLQKYYNFLLGGVRNLLYVHFQLVFTSLKNFIS